MSANCAHDHVDRKNAQHPNTPRYRKILWIALVVNLAMFAIEIGAGFKSGSTSLLADAIDFFAMRPTTACRWRCCRRVLFCGREQPSLKAFA